MQRHGIGIDGFNNANLIQTGTEQDIVHGHPQYYAWSEILPASETPIAMAVSPSEVMSASIARNGLTGHLATIQGTVEQHSLWRGWLPP